MLCLQIMLATCPAVAQQDDQSSSGHVVPVVSEWTGHYEGTHVGLPDGKVVSDVTRGLVLWLQGRGDDWSEFGVTYPYAPFAPPSAFTKDGKIAVAVVGAGGATAALRCSLVVDDEIVSSTGYLTELGGENAPVDARVVGFDMDSIELLALGSRLQPNARPEFAYPLQRLRISWDGILLSREKLAVADSILAFWTEGGSAHVLLQSPEPEGSAVYLGVLGVHGLELTLLERNEFARYEAGNRVEGAVILVHKSYHGKQLTGSLVEDDWIASTQFLFPSSLALPSIAGGQYLRSGESLTLTYARHGLIETRELLGQENREK